VVRGRSTNQRAQMKVLVAVDDSPVSGWLFDDLSRAGLPSAVEILVLTVAEFEPASTAAKEAERSVALPATGVLVGSVERIRREHPNWEVGGEVVSGSVASKLVDRASEWKADLLIIGSHGRGLIGRMFLGSVSLAVLHRAHCPVRIVRAPLNTPSAEVLGSPVRIMLAYDGAPCSDAAFAAILSRSWPQRSTLRIVACVEPVISSAYSYSGYGVDRVMAEVEDERKLWLGEKLAHLKAQAASSFDQITTSVVVGMARELLLQEAETEQADVIFMGAHGRTGVDSWLIGSVSQSIATHARCTVEVVKR
jgi:nucleotide-binding universal stress UspA family protein